MKYTRDEQVHAVKGILSDLYNGLALERYGSRYDELKSVILNDYRRLNQGTHPNQIIANLLSQLNEEVLRNLHLQQTNPNVMTQAMKKLKRLDTQPGMEKTFNHFGNMFPY